MQCTDACPCARDRRCAHFTPLQQQLQQDQNAEEEEDLVEQARAKKRTATIAAMNRRNAEAQQFLAQIQSVKAASKVRPPPPPKSRQNLHYARGT